MYCSLYNLNLRLLKVLSPGSLPYHACGSKARSAVAWLKSWCAAYAYIFYMCMHTQPGIKVAHHVHAGLPPALSSPLTDRWYTFNTISHQSQSLTSLCWSYTCRRHTCRDWRGQILLAHWPGIPPGFPNVSPCYWPKEDCCRGWCRLLLICSRLLIRVGRAPRRIAPPSTCPGHRYHLLHCHCLNSCLACSTAS